MATRLPAKRPRRLRGIPNIRGNESEPPRTGARKSLGTPIGTIFGIFRRKSHEGTHATIDDILQCGREMIAAGYIIYGSGTVFVLSVRVEGVHGFT